MIYVPADKSNDMKPRSFIIREAL